MPEDCVIVFRRPKKVLSQGVIREVFQEEMGL